MLFGLIKEAGTPTSWTGGVPVNAATRQEYGHKKQQIKGKLTATTSVLIKQATVTSSMSGDMVIDGK